MSVFEGKYRVRFVFSIFATLSVKVVNRHGGFIGCGRKFTLLLCGCLLVILKLCRTCLWKETTVAHAALNGVNISRKLHSRDFVGRFPDNA